MTRRIVDLTFPIHEGMTTFPSSCHTAVKVTRLGQHEVDHRETRKLELGTHTGTHCDAPCHFIPGGDTVDRLPLDVLIGQAFVADFSGVRHREADVPDFEKQLGTRHAERLIMRFDWSEHWGKSDYYTHSPFISHRAARWLTDRGVRLLAMDIPSPDNPAECFGSELDSPNHKILLENGVILVEYLCNLKALNQPEVELIVLPLKVLGADGSPARCVAIESI
jgi:arylformamidase